MINKVKKYLKKLSKSEVKKVINHSDLTDIEQWLIYYTYGEKRMVINTCMKLNISRPQFFITQLSALIKLYYILEINNLDS